VKTLVIIPAYNESNNLDNLIKEIKSFGYDYLVINDSSTDNTEQLAKEKNYNILNLTVNVGLAGVTRIGFKYAYDNDYDCAVSIDGDGQHPPKYIHSLIKEVQNGNQYVTGSRYIEKEKPFTFRMIGSRLLCWLIKLKTREKVTDPTSGMRVLGKEVLEDFSESMNFYAEPDAMCYCLKKGYKVKEVQVNMNERVEGRSYFANPFKSIKYMLAVIISIIFIN